MGAARGLIALGFEAGDGLVILGANRPQWMIANLAAIAAGGLPTGLYTTATPAQCGYIAEHCRASVAVVEHAGFLGQLASVRDRLRAVVVMSGAAEGCIGWDELLALGDARSEQTLAARIAALEPDQPCTLIYTSGTTGAPKGVMLSHDNLLWTAGSLAEELGIDSSYRGLSYLPLSHVAEQVVSLYAGLVTGGCIAFADSLETVLDDLRHVRPTFFFAVPRVWEKIQARMEAVGARSGGLRRRLVRWARAVGLRAGRARQRGEPLPGGYWLADRLVFRRVRRLLGFDRVEYFVTRPRRSRSRHLEFFLSLDITLLEVYGMTECSGPDHVVEAGPLPGRDRPGVAIPGTEIRVTDGRRDLHARAARVPRLLQRPRGDPGGARRRGLASLGRHRYGRRRRLPAHRRPQEGDHHHLGRQERRAGADRAQVQGGPRSVPGDRGRRAAPVSRRAADPGPRAGARELPAEIGSAARTRSRPPRARAFRAYLEEQVARINATLASYESIKRFAVLPGQLSVEDGTLTPTLKLRRRAIDERLPRRHRLGCTTKVQHRAPKSPSRFDRETASSGGRSSDPWIEPGPSNSHSRSRPSDGLTSIYPGVCSIRPLHPSQGGRRVEP